MMSRLTWKPSLQLSAVRALEAKVNGDPTAPIAIAAFREQLHIETGLSETLIALLKSESVL